MDAKDTVAKLLDSAQALVQERGFNAFSYKDLASEVGIRTASIHYHFPTKADLGRALMQRYTEGLAETLADFDGRLRSNKARLKALLDLYRDTERCGAICLCGSLASDLGTLPDEVAEVVQAYLETTESWVREKIEDGIRAEEFAPTARATDLAATLVASLQGALIIARARRGDSALAHVQRSLLTSLGVS